MDVTINPWSGHISAATALMTAIHVRAPLLLSVGGAFLFAAVYSYNSSIFPLEMVSW